MLPWQQPTCRSSLSMKRINGQTKLVVPYWLVALHERANPDRKKEEIASCFLPLKVVMVISLKKQVL